MHDLTKIASLAITAGNIRVLSVDVRRNIVSLIGGVNEACKVAHPALQRIRVKVQRAGAHQALLLLTLGYGSYLRTEEILLDLRVEMVQRIVVAIERLLLCDAVPAE